MPGGRPLKYQSVEELDAAITKYFKDKSEAKMPFTVSGLALALDISRQTFLNYSEREEFMDSLSRAKQFCEDYAESMLFVGRNPSGAQFALQNNYAGWKDVKRLAGDEEAPPIKASLEVRFIEP